MTTFARIFPPLGDSGLETRKPVDLLNEFRMLGGFLKTVEQQCGRKVDAFVARDSDQRFVVQRLERGVILIVRRAMKQTRLRFPKESVSAKEHYAAGVTRFRRRRDHAQPIRTPITKQITPR